jgi:hypothetical protein
MAFSQKDHFYLRIPLRSLTSALHLSEADYPVHIDWGIAIFSQPPDAIPEQCGELPFPVAGLNYLRVANIRLPVAVPVTCVEDEFTGGYCPAKTPKDAISRWKKYILKRREDFGFRVTTQELRKVHRAIARIPGYWDENHE